MSNLHEAYEAAEHFKDLLKHTGSRWTIAGSVRRCRSQVKDIEHVVAPVFGEVVGDDMFGTPRMVNMLWHSIDLFVKDGHFAKAEYTDKNGRTSHRWGDKYRGVMFGGFKHEIFTATPDSFGAILAIRTGPSVYSQYLVTVIRQHGYQVRDGQVFPLGREHPVAVREEQDFFHLCGVKMPEPQDRSAVPGMSKTPDGKTDAALSRSDNQAIDDMIKYDLKFQHENSKLLENIGCPEFVYIQGKRFAICPLHYRSFGDGYCDRQEQKILLNAYERHSERVRETLLHEIIHGITKDLIEGEINLDCYGRATEQSVMVISVGLWQVLNDPRNAGVAEWIFFGQRRLFERQGDG